MFTICSYFCPNFSKKLHSTVIMIYYNTGNRSNDTIEGKKTYLMRILSTARSSHRRCSVGKGVLKNFAKFTGKHLCQSLFFNIVEGLGLFSQSRSGRLLLYSQLEIMGLNKIWLLKNLAMLKGYF